MSSPYSDSIHIFNLFASSLIPILIRVPVSTLIFVLTHIHSGGDCQVSLSSSFFCFYPTQQTQPRAAPRPQSRNVRSLLIRHNLGHFADILISNGYDDLRFIKETTDDELKDVGVNLPEDRALVSNYVIHIKRQWQTNIICYGIEWRLVESYSLMKSSITDTVSLTDSSTLMYFRYVVLCVNCLY